MKPTITIIGTGYYGTFLRDILSPHAEITDQAEHVILAVPFEAYDEVSAKHAGKHLINVCSIQEAANDICLKHSNLVTGFHPLFGPKSPTTGRSGLLTLECAESKVITDLFEQIGTKIIHQVGDWKVDGALHDRMMAESHALTVYLSQTIGPAIRKAHWIPDECLPASFKALREFIHQYEDMSPGTVSSILSNPYFENPFETINN